MFLFRFISRRVEEYKQRTMDGATVVWDNVFKGGMLALFSATVIWLSIFLYVAFYYYYMPSVYHHRPVHLQFKTCDTEESGMCSFPVAHVQLTKYQQLLMVGQTYRIYLKLEMPESPANKDLGMFMVCAQLADKDGVIVSHSCRSSMLHYRSQLLSLLTTLTFYPLFLFGNTEEKQIITLELYSNYEEDQNHPVTDLYIELQARRIEYYSASVHIQAHLKGMRYLMFHWPLLSAILGISSNLFFIIFLVSLSWYQVQIRGYKDATGHRSVSRSSDAWYRWRLFSPFFSSDEDFYEIGDSSISNSENDSDTSSEVIEEQQHLVDANEEDNDGSPGSTSQLFGARQMIQTLVRRQGSSQNLPST